MSGDTAIALARMFLKVMIRARGLDVIIVGRCAELIVLFLFIFAVGFVSVGCARE